MPAATRSASTAVWIAAKTPRWRKPGCPPEQQAMRFADLGPEPAGLQPSHFAVNQGIPPNQVWRWRRHHGMTGQPRLDIAAESLTSAKTGGGSATGYKQSPPAQSTQTSQRSEAARLGAPDKVATTTCAPAPVPSAGKALYRAAPGAAIAGKNIVGARFVGRLIPGADYNPLWTGATKLLKLRPSRVVVSSLRSGSPVGSRRWRSASGGKSCEPTQKPLRFATLPSPL